MRKPGLLVLVAVAAALSCQDAGDPMAARAPADEAAFSKTASADSRGGEWVFRSERMVGNDVTGAGGAIRGQNAGGIPWRLDFGEARLSRNGELRVRVEGLVLQTTGTNPIPAFKAILSCLTNGPTNTLVTVNLSTATVPVGADGNASIREELAGIPDPCYGPIVLVTSAGGSWFAVTGF